MKTRTAIITGATSGIGAAFACHLARAGYNLLLTGRRMERLEQMKTELEQTHGIDVKYVVADLANTAEYNGLLRAIHQLPTVDMLINNAGFGNRTDFFESDFFEQQKMLDVHITATTRLVHEVVPLMREQGKGAIINVASLAAFLPAKLSYFYCSTKAFLVAFTECLRVDLLHTGIKVQALCPGFTKTEFHDKAETAHQNDWMCHPLFWMTADEVVQYSLHSLARSNVICIPGYCNRCIYWISRFIPRNLYYKLSAGNGHVAPVPALCNAA